MYTTLSSMVLYIHQYRTTFLGYNFSAPIFIAPAARAVYGDERAELNFVDAAANENILYTVSALLPGLHQWRKKA